MRALDDAPCVKHVAAFREQVRQHIVPEGNLSSCIAYLFLVPFFVIKVSPFQFVILSNSVLFF